MHVCTCAVCTTGPFKTPADLDEHSVSYSGQLRHAEIFIHPKICSLELSREILQGKESDII